jgi:hypothetical protein
MIRYLAGADEIDHTLPLSLYINIFKRDLWDETLLDDHEYMFDNLDKHLPVDILLEDIHCCYTVICELNIEFNQIRSSKPAIQPVLQAPVRLP